MRLRNKLDGTTQSAELEVHRFGDGRSQFLLFLHHADGSVATLGNVAAAIAVELMDCTPQELVALRLAGFHLARAGTGQPGLQRLARLLTAAKRKPLSRLANSARGAARSESFRKQESVGGRTDRSRSHAAHHGKNYEGAPHRFGPKRHSPTGSRVQRDSRERELATKGA
jgi:hypothetical protein